MVNSYTVIFLCVIHNVYTFSSQHAWMKPMFGPFKKPKQSLRVYDGVFDHNNEYVYVVALGWMENAEKAKILFDRSVEGEGPFFVRGCSGSLVSPLWVLSAEHCVGNGGPEGGPEGTPSHIRYGNTTIPPDEKSFSYSRVRKRVSHVKADIGLILLQEQDKVSLATYGVISSVDYKTLAGLTVKYVGYGVTDIPTSGDVLEFAMKHQTKNRRIGEALVVPCRHYMKTLYKQHLMYRIIFSTPKICIVPKCSQRLAAGLHGDSGGPMLRLGRIVGVIVTWTGNFQPTNTITPVSAYIDWISSVMSLSQ